MQSRSVASFVLGVFFLACGASAGDGAGDPTADAGTPTTDADTPVDSSVQLDAGRADVVTGPTVGLDRAAQLVEETPSTTKPGTMFICATTGKLGIESYL